MTVRGIPLHAPDSSDSLVRIRRPDGKETLLRVPGEHLQRVMDLAVGEFGDKSIVLGDIPPPRK